MSIYPNARTAYRESDVRGASRVKLVVLLYEQMIQDLTQAARAIEQNDIPLRTKLINHAILVVGHLQSPLDFEKGGKTAHELDRFYNALRQNLVQVQFFPSKPGVCQLITDLLAVREAWIEVERTENSPVTAAATVPSRAPDPASDPLRPNPVHMDWKG
jgi:flagellar secretion chaperone FliS